MIHIEVIERCNSIGQVSGLCTYMTGVEEMERKKGECQLLPTASRVSQDETPH